MDLLLVIVPSLLFGLLVAVHVGLCAALFASIPRWHALLALLVPPLAPYFCLTSNRRGLTWLWLGALTAYAVALGLAALA